MAARLFPNTHLGLDPGMANTPGGFGWVPSYHITEQIQTAEGSEGLACQVIGKLEGFLHRQVSTTTKPHNRLPVASPTCAAAVRTRVRRATGWRTVTDYVYKWHAS